VENSCPEKQRRITMRKDEWFISPEIFFSCLLVLTVAFIISDIVQGRRMAYYLNI
jgi:hypothetical protein